MITRRSEWLGPSLDRLVAAMLRASLDLDGDGPFAADPNGDDGWQNFRQHGCEAAAAR
jgi:hypothetical protein